MTKSGKALRASVLLSLLAILAGCEQFEISDRTMKINDAVQNADTRQVLVNIVRASKQYPLIFTATSQILSSGIADSSTLGLTIPFGPKNGNVYSASPSLKLQEGLSVTTVPLDTQEFEEGFLQPLSVSTVGYYLANGWSPQIILHAFVQEIDMPEDFVHDIKLAVAKTCKSGSVMPYPGADPGTVPPKPVPCLLVPDVKLFITQTDSKHHCLQLKALAAAPTTDHVGGTARFVNSIDESHCGFATFQYFIALLEALNMRVETVPAAANGMSLSIPTDDNSVKIKVDTGSAGKDKTSFAVDTVLSCLKQPGPKASAAERAQAESAQTAPTFLGNTATGGQAAGASSPSCKGASDTRIVLRAPEGVIYYLGSLMNAAFQNFVVTVRNPGYGDDMPLFSLSTSGTHAAPRDAIATTEVDDDTYYIPKPAAGSLDQTMHMITLVQQIVALQKKGSSLPTVPTVQLIGQ